MAKNDIDDIFANKKTRKSDTIDLSESSKPSTLKPKVTSKTISATNATKTSSNVASKTFATKQPPMPNDDLFTDLKGSKRRKTTEEGFRVYDDEELKIDPNAGNTDECPFDCSCCY